jgi:mRNA-degrading endonuclease toxin of MazEF toxin-antitoxin module
VEFGEVFELKAPPPDGTRAIADDRYAIIVHDFSSDPRIPFALAVPVTASRFEILRNIPLSFVVPQHGRSGCFKNCVAMVYQMRSFDIKSFGKRMGLLEDHLQAALKRHLTTIFNGVILPSSPP